MKIEKLFVSSLGSAENLKWYLDDDVNLVNYLNAMNPRLMFLISMTASAIPKGMLTSEIGKFDFFCVLKILKKERPDLHKILDTKKGLVWLDREINNFKRYFLK